MRFSDWVGLCGVAAVAVGILTAGGGVGAMPLAAMAAESRDRVRLDLLDTCVFDQWKKRDVKDQIVDDCQCAAEAAAEQFTDDQVDKFNGKLSASVMPLWKEAYDACLKS